MLLRLRASVLIAMMLLMSGPVARAQDAQEIRLSIGSTDYSHGAAVATALTRASNLPATCPDKDMCGVPGVYATAGSAGNAAVLARQLADGALDLAILPGPVAYAAICADKVSKFSAKLDNLRLLGGLYVEVMHLLVRRGSDIRTVEDLAGKRVALSDSGTGLRIAATLVVNAYGVSTTSLRNTALEGDAAAAALRNGTLDAWLVLAPFPDRDIAALIADGTAWLLPVTGQPAVELVRTRPYFVTGAIPRSAYGYPYAVPSVGSYTALYATDALEPGLARRLTAALWRPANRSGMAGIAGSRGYAGPARLSGALAGRLHDGAAAHHAHAGEEMRTLPCFEIP